eukprot:1484747-Alexandrium_andersonii.AAC.1
MSASLVGSEMCIRDRSQHARGAEEPSSRLEVGESRRPARRLQRLALSRTCLLYTSDAADDM